MIPSVEGQIMVDKGNGIYGIPDKIWEQIEPLLLPVTHESERGFPCIDNRRAMAAILYTLRTGGDLRDIKAENPVYEYLKEWRRTGVFDRMWQVGVLTYDELRKLVLQDK
jgi:putative transposase